VKQSGYASLIVLCAVLCLSVPALSVGLEKKYVEVKKDDKCRVCGMFVAKYREWIAEIIFSDGTYAVFDGPKDMLKYYFNPGKYSPSRKQADIQSLYVTEYYSTRMMDARNMFYVEGSDVNGPMGAELVPVETENRAREFMKDHKGKKIIKFSEIRKEDIN
jgi:nitrous oxide reductase accessory protein NosL